MWGCDVKATTKQEVEEEEEGEENNNNLNNNLNNLNNLNKPHLLVQLGKMRKEI